MMAVRNGTFDARHYCWHQAMLLLKSNPNKYTVVIGSYGFRQADGNNVFLMWG